MGLLDMISDSLDPKFQLTELTKPSTIARNVAGDLIGRLPTKSRDYVQLGRTTMGLLGKSTRVPTVIRNII
jgi:hypothetical protein